MDAVTPAPESAVEGVTEPSAETQVEETAPVSEAEKSVSQKSENRYQKLANENRSLKEKAAKIQEYEKQIESLKDAKNLDAWLRSDVRHVKEFMKLIEELAKPQTQQASSSDPDEEYLVELAKVDPRAAALLREARETRRELLSLKQQQDQERQERLTSSTQEIQQTRDAEYDDFLEKNGYTKEGKPVDATLVDGFNKISLAWLAQNAKDWKRATTQEMKSACEYANSVVNAGKKLGMKSTVKAPGVPLSGSKQGGIPSSKGKDTDASRQARILSQLQ